MADQKKWFKVWASIVGDDCFMNLSMESIGRWTLLGAFICQHGTNGKILIKPPSTFLLSLFQVGTLDQLKMVFNVLPNVHLDPPINDNGDFFVTIKNWRKYQVDSTIAERVNSLRRKKRGEEKRKEEGESVTFPTSKPLAGPYGG